MVGDEGDGGVVTGSEVSKTQNRLIIWAYLWCVQIVFINKKLDEELWHCTEQ